MYPTNYLALMIFALLHGCKYFYLCGILRHSHPHYFQIRVHNRQSYKGLKL